MRIFEASSEPMSLRWDGEELEDVLGGFRRWTADGTELPGTWEPPYPFDQAVYSPSGRWTVVYQQHREHALLLDGRDVVRVLDREYIEGDDPRSSAPALATLPDGREVLFTPDLYLKIEDLVAGKDLTYLNHHTVGMTEFHRFTPSPDGRRLAAAEGKLSDGGGLRVYDVAEGLADGSHFLGDGLIPRKATADGTVGSVCWLDADRLAVAMTGWQYGIRPPERLGPWELGVWSFTEERWLHRSPATGPWGTIVAVGGNRVVALDGHPRLVDATTGEELTQWPEVPLPEDELPYGRLLRPVTAVHPDSTRLAIAARTSITVLDLG
ncbi:WD40 repeat domain-containing protein [Streptomyces erythrochromogenes]|uniref:hypothetical protein n=1 Tax=Streptomyces erythrochromogenes TaxID=285574 RepID=UPI0036840081